MKIQHICGRSIALYTSIDELNSRGICESRINSRHTADMIREGFNLIGIPACGAMEVETYINGRAVLIFAHLCKTEKRTDALFCFESFEHLICVCHCITSFPDATLLWKDGHYYLALHGTICGSIFHIFKEHAALIPEPELTFASLLEHGKLIGAGDILLSIARNFTARACNNNRFADSLNPVD